VKMVYEITKHAKKVMEERGSLLRPACAGLRRAPAAGDSGVKVTAFELSPREFSVYSLIGP